jgi:hypothetical protein
MEASFRRVCSKPIVSMWQGNMNGPTFDPQLWERDIHQLPDDRRELTAGILAYVQSALLGVAYHRRSGHRSGFEVFAAIGLFRQEQDGEFGIFQDRRSSRHSVDEKG